MKLTKLLCAAAAVLLLLWGCEEPVIQESPGIDLTAIPVWDGQPYVVVDGNEPGFTADDLTTDDFEQYSALDPLGRCGTAYACVSQALLADEITPEEMYDAVKTAAIDTFGEDGIVVD